MKTDIIEAAGSPAGVLVQSRPTTWVGNDGLPQFKALGALVIEGRGRSYCGRAADATRWPYGERAGASRSRRGTVASRGTPTPGVS